jgi:hypothetical protein
MQLPRGILLERLSQTLPDIEASNKETFDTSGYHRLAGVELVVVPVGAASVEAVSVVAASAEALAQV